jgi:hypothetical protein
MGLGPHLRGLGRSPIETGATRSLRRSHLQGYGYQPCHLQRLAQQSAICRDMDTSLAICSALPNSRPSAGIWIPALPSAAPCPTVGHLPEYGSRRPSAAPCPTVGHLPEYGSSLAICSVAPSSCPSAGIWIPALPSAASRPAVAHLQEYGYHPCHLQRLAQQLPICRNMDTTLAICSALPSCGHLRRHARQPATCGASQVATSDPPTSALRASSHCRPGCRRRSRCPCRRRR